MDAAWPAARMQALDLLPLSVRYPNTLSCLFHAEIDDLLLSVPSLTPAGFLNQAIDELVEIVPDDSRLEEEQTTTKRFRITLERSAKIAWLAADTGHSENAVAIVAIRQLARRQPS